jgi:hypothetical protein
MAQVVLGNAIASCEHPLVVEPGYEVMPRRRCARLCHLKNFSRISTRAPQPDLAGAARPGPGLFTENKSSEVNGPSSNSLHSR